ncbi:MAG: hypothetical protein IJJ56_14025 [Prevotella sp.]|nr:hypothetical protein [Prevotella sp.]
MEKGIINTQAKLSEHFTLGEMIKTNAKGLDNTPPHAAVLNLKNICENWLEDLRYSYNLLYCIKKGDDYETSKDVEPLIINSGFRSEAVNKAVGGAKESNHLTGCAVDIKCLGIEQAIRYSSILLDIADGKKQEFDELLIERSPKGSYWMHFAVRPLKQDNRRKVKFLQT